MHRMNSVAQNQRLAKIILKISKKTIHKTIQVIFSYTTNELMQFLAFL